MNSELILYNSFIIFTIQGVHSTQELYRVYTVHKNCTECTQYTGTVQGVHSTQVLYRNCTNKQVLYKQVLYKHTDTVQTLNLLQYYKMFGTASSLSIEIIQRDSDALNHQQIDVANERLSEFF